MTSSKTTVDWLRFRTQAQPREAVEALRAMYGGLGQSMSIVHADRGRDGFRHGATIHVAQLAVGRLDYGGDAQRGWVRVNLTGVGCEWVRDWDAIAEVERLDRAEIRRLDIALTTWRGEVTHEAVVSAHTAGRFTTGGRPPSLRQITSSDPREGRTCYVGNREGEKFLRAYEKGLQLAAKLPKNLADAITHIDGCAVEDIYRCELELKADTRPVPWEVVERRDQYFAGAYPFCADILPGVEADILQRRPERAPQTELRAALENCRQQYGNTLFTALVALHGDIGAVWERIVGRDHNRALVDAGVLMVDHDDATGGFRDGRASQLH